MRPFLVRLLAALSCAGAASIAGLGVPSCSGPERQLPELPDLASPASPTVAEPAPADPLAPRASTEVPILDPGATPVPYARADEPRLQAIVLDGGTIVDSTTPLDARP